MKLATLADGRRDGSPAVVSKDLRRVARAEQTLAHRGPRTPFLRFGERVRIEERDGAGRSIFGAMDQAVLAAK